MTKKWAHPLYLGPILMVNPSFQCLMKDQQSWDNPNLEGGESFPERGHQSQKGALPLGPAR